MISLKEAFAQALLDEPRRPSHGGLHVGDVANECARFVWHRLHNDEKRVWDAQTACKMAQGFGVEDLVRSKLASELEKTGWRLHPQYAVVIDPESGLPGTVALEQAASVDARLVVGHPDLVFALDHNVYLVEVKSTMFFREKGMPVAAPTMQKLREKHLNWVIQGAAYAYAVGAKEYSVFVVDRGTGIFEEYVFVTAQEYPLFEQRLLVLSQALGDDEPSPSLPVWTVFAGKSYLCKSCPIIECSMHPDHQAMWAALEEPSADSREARKRAFLAKYATKRPGWQP